MLLAEDPEDHFNCDELLVSSLEPVPALVHTYFVLDNF